MSGIIPKPQELEALIFGLNKKEEFAQLALSIFHFQYSYNEIYQKYCCQLGVAPQSVTDISKIPFLPISFFKSHKIKTTEFHPQSIFESSGTTGITTSRHYVKDLRLYRQSALQHFEKRYGDLSTYAIVALLPSYLERDNSSLVFMVKDWMEVSGHSLNGFYLNDHEKLNETISLLQENGQKTLLIGVTYALLDFAACHARPLKNIIVMETGGMKGRKKEQTREEVHQALSTAFDLTEIHSEYGMTELLSQAYAEEKGLFQTPAWMQVLLRPEDDPLDIISASAKPVTGIINVIDLANLWSCSFIATEDAGRLYANGSFEVLGRIDNSDVRGCSLLSL